MLTDKHSPWTKPSRAAGGCARSSFGYAVLTLVPLLAWGQPHVKEEGAYLLRASTVSAQALPEEMRSEHGIPSDPGKAVLNVTVQKKADGRTHNVPARLDVAAHNLMGVPTGVDMRRVMANGMVSYLGVYDFLPREALNFRILAWPEGANSSIELTFTDRLGRR